MAYCDVLSSDSYGSYNIKLAKLAGLQTAVYWGCILNVISKVVKKKTYDQSGCFKLDRKYVENQTTLTEAEQGLCDKALERLEVVKVDPADNNRIYVDQEKLFLILINDDQTVLKSVGKATKVSRMDKAAGKREGIINRLKSRVNEPDPELFELYGKLIETCYDRGMTQNAQIDLFQQEINEYTSDQKVKVDLLTIGISRGYKVFEWCKSIYEKEYRPTASRPAAQKVASAVSETNLF